MPRALLVPLVPTRNKVDDSDSDSDSDSDARTVVTRPRPGTPTAGDGTHGQSPQTGSGTDACSQT